MLRTSSRWVWFVVLCGLPFVASACQREAPPSEPADAGADLAAAVTTDLVAGPADAGAAVELAQPAVPSGELPGESPPEAPEGAALEFAFPHVDPEPVDHLAAARSARELGDQAAAMLELEKALHDDPANFTAALLLGQSAAASGRPQLATDAWLFAAGLRPAEDEPWLELAGLMLARGDLAEAEQLVRRALLLRPERARGHNLLGRIWLARSHWERAIAAFERALELAPASLYARNNLGLALLRKRDFQRAVAVLQPLGDQDRATAFMLNNLGLAYEGLGRLPDASATYRQALERAPGYLKARLNLARLTELAQRLEPGEAGE
ncbi:MAG TPA: tetratricopeptide repeat protein [Myxococcota bacterium]|nr:tetratricopeptide repeat protein [Myxococcota bacterium]